MLVLYFVSATKAKSIIQNLTIERDQAATRLERDQAATHFKEVSGI